MTAEYKTVFGEESDASEDSYPAYETPADWPTLTPVPVGTQKFQGLVAVFNSSTNFLAFTVSGNYTVDWGDGTSVENVSSGVQADPPLPPARAGQ